MSIFCFLGNVISGIVLGFSAILLPQLEKQRNEPLPDTETSLIGITEGVPFKEENEDFNFSLYYVAGMANFGQVFGSIMGGVLAVIIGRRSTLIIRYATFALSFFFTAGAGGNTTFLVIARFFQGLGIVPTVNQVKRCCILFVPLESRLCYLSECLT